MPGSSECRLFEPIDKTGMSNCINCHYWNTKKHWCNGEYLLIKKRRESDDFRKYDHMMRMNRGISLEE